MNSAGQRDRKKIIICSPPTDRSGCLPLPSLAGELPFLPIYTQHGMPRPIGVLASCPHASTRQHCSLAPSPHQPRRSIQCSCCRLVFLRSYVPPHPLVLALNCCRRRRAMSWLARCGLVAGVQESGRGPSSSSWTSGGACCLDAIFLDSLVGFLQDFLPDLLPPSDGFLVGSRFLCRRHGLGSGFRFRGAVVGLGGGGPRPDHAVLRRAGVVLLLIRRRRRGAAP